MESIDALDQIVIFARLGERFFITALILISCVFLMRVYRGRIQAIDFNMDTKAAKLGLAASFSMPVFLFLILVIFSFVAFSNPTHYTRTSSNGEQTGGEEKNATKTESSGFVGLASTEEEIREQIRSLGMIGSAAAELGKLKRDGLIDQPKAISATEQIFSATKPLVGLRLALLEQLHPKGNLRQNCSQFLNANSTVVPTLACEAYVEDYRLGLE